MAYNMTMLNCAICLSVSVAAWQKERRIAALRRRRFVGYWQTLRTDLSLIFLAKRGTNLENETWINLTVRYIFHASKSFIIFHTVWFGELQSLKQVVSIYFRKCVCVIFFSSCEWIIPNGVIYHITWQITGSEVK